MEHTHENLRVACKELAYNFYEMKNNHAHIRSLQQAINHGLKLKQCTEFWDLKKLYF